MIRKSGLIFLLLCMIFVVVSSVAFAAEEEEALDSMVKTGLAIASGLAIGIAALGGGLGQGRAIASGLEGIARNPGASDKIMTPMIIGLALIESLVIYAFVISIMLYLKI